MAEDLIRYDVLAQDALRGLVHKVLTEVAQAGLPGEHHFFVTFNTRFPGVRISSRLAAEYPSEMTVVLQHQFWDLPSPTRPSRSACRSRACRKSCMCRSVRSRASSIRMRALR